MRTTRRLVAAVGAASLALSAACSTDLEVTNPNNPDIDRALASAEDVKNIAISTINSWYLVSTDYDPAMVFEVTADALTGNFGNFGMRFNNVEPRIPYGNSSAGADRRTAERPWDGNYGTLGAANDVLRAFAGGIVIPGGASETEKYKHLAQFSQALSLMNLGLIFDKAFVVDESFNVASGTKPELKPYKEVTAAALAKWDALIAGTAGKSHSYDPSVLPMSVGPLTSARINRLANTFAAATMAYSSRTAAEAATVNWGKVAEYAEKGIGTGSAGAPFDMVVIGDFNNWYSYINYYGNEPSWTRVDLRLINMMDPSQPRRFTGTADIKAPATTNVDARLATDFRFHGAVIGDPARGVYMQSPFSHSRYFAHARTSPTRAATPVPYLLAAESDLLLAEALVRTNRDLARAATLINNTRVGRGKLAPVAAGDGAPRLLEAIYYERDIELLNTNAFTLFHRRMIDGLQPGTLRQLPIPAKELETLGLPIYTFGGTAAGSVALDGPGGAPLGLRRATRSPAARDVAPEY